MEFSGLTCPVLGIGEGERRPNLAQHKTRNRVTGLTYKDRLTELDLPTLEQREGGDLSRIYKLGNRMEETDNEE